MFRKTLILNWKHQCPHSWRDFVQKLSFAAFDSPFNIVLAPPAPLLEALKPYCHQFFSLAAQDATLDPLGPYTGVIGLELVRSLEYNYVLLGHSECINRGQTYELIAQKAQKAAELQLTPIICLNEEQINQPFYLQKLISSRIQSFLHIAFEPPGSIGGDPISTHQIKYYYDLLLKNIPSSSQCINFFYGGGCNLVSLPLILELPFLSGVLLGRLSLNLGLIDFISDSKTIVVNQ